MDWSCLRVLEFLGEPEKPDGQLLRGSKGVLNKREALPVLLTPHFGGQTQHPRFDELGTGTKDEGSVRSADPESLDFYGTI